MQYDRVTDTEKDIFCETNTFLFRLESKILHENIKYNNLILYVLYLLFKYNCICSYTF